LSIYVRRALKAEHWDPVAYEAVVYREQHPDPESFEREVDPALPGGVELGMSKAVHSVRVLLEDVCEHTRPGGEEGIVEKWKPLKEIDLAAEAVEDGEP
jgi:hypothetical protein